MSASSPFGVYIHWPFCTSKCPYCNFNSHVRSGGIDEAKLAPAYLRELAHWAELAPGRSVRSIFFGGGTPSLMRASTVGAIIAAIAGHWPVERDAEITLEANPGSVEAGRFRDYRSAGVNRISLGVQSLIDGELRALGRLHTAKEALNAIDLAARLFPRHSFDLIYARPHQTPSAWRAELRDALALSPRHLSLYELTIEPATPFAWLKERGRLALPGSAAKRELYEITQELAERAGLEAYEISNHAVRGEECRHNLIYWRYGEYAGVGPGAHGRVIVEGRRQATKTADLPERWEKLIAQEGHGIIEATPLLKGEEADEALLMGLRLKDGIDLERLRRLSGMAPRAEAIGELIDLGLIERRGELISATAAGRPLLNAIILRLSAALAPQAGGKGRSVTRK